MFWGRAMSKEKRTKFWVENKVQGALARRLLAYWCFNWLWIVGFTLLATFFYSFAVTELSNRELVNQALGHFAPLAFISLLMLPIIVRDYIRLSHRFAGPMVKFRRATQQLAAGQMVRPIELRDGDYWQEFAEDFNRMLAVVQSRRPGLADDAAQEVDTNDTEGDRRDTECGSEAFLLEV